ncbi:MAG: hypothetical protein R3E50_01785 [Halioglobus sp.]
MRYRASRVLTGFLLMCVCAVAVSVRSLAQDLAGERRDYAAAVRAIDRGHWTEYERLRPRLDDYPLAVYLDYFQLTRQADQVPPEQARGFLSRSADTPLPNRFLAVYLRSAGKAQRWQDFLDVMPSEPNSADLKCYYFRAQLARGNEDIAWDGARKLWQRGESQPGECDPLFASWEAAGGLTDPIVWTRLLNAFEARQQSLLQFVAQKAGPGLRPWADRLLTVYHHPETLPTLALPADSPYAADIASYGLAYLAGYSPEQALSSWTELQRHLRVTPEQAQRVEYAIARQSLLARTAAHVEWLNGALARLGDDQLVGIRLRWALAEQDWDAVQRNLPLLSEAGRGETVWRYWAAIAQEQAGATAAAKATLEQLAGERDYYGFLAADRLGRSYAFNHQRLAMTDPSPVAGLPAVRRIEELDFQQEDVLAHSEWFKLLQDTSDPAQQRDLAVLASQKGWYRMAIDAATRAQAWDALDQRFPTPYQDIFGRYARERQVPSTELLAIARARVRFFPRAIAGRRARADAGDAGHREVGGRVPAARPPPHRPVRDRPQRAARQRLLPAVAGPLRRQSRVRPHRLQRRSQSRGPLAPQGGGGHSGGAVD